VLGDMRTADPGGGFDALVAWDSVFHVLRVDHRAVLRRFRSWLRRGGRALVSLGGSAFEGTCAMHGERFFYSGYDPGEAVRLVAAAGLALVHSELDDLTSRGHLAVLVVAR
jgi:hypothetical protein